MKKGWLLGICLFEMFLLTALLILAEYFPETYSSFLAFPFEQIAIGLGELAETGAVGNGVSMALWIGLSAFPLVLALTYKKEKETFPERMALVVLSVVVFSALFGMINPQVFNDTDAIDISGSRIVTRSILGVAIWSAVILYVLLRSMRQFRKGNKEQLLRYLGTGLCVLCFLFSAMIAAYIAPTILFYLDTAKTGADKVCQGFRVMTMIIPTILMIFVVFRMLDLLESAKKDDKAGITLAAKKVGGTCYMALGVMAGLVVISNLVQILMLRRATDIEVLANVPIVSILFFVMVLLLSRLLIENKELRDDNSLFI